jgi:hypothetical protein
MVLFSGQQADKLARVLRLWRTYAIGVIGAENMPAKKTKAPVFCLKVTLLEVEPAVWRRVRMPGDLKLHEVHELLQKLMGWQNAHPHRFVIAGQEFGPKWSEYGMAKIRDERRTTLERAVKLAGKGFKYDYDFGDGWLPEVIVEETLPWEKGSWIPICLEGAAACPPEDCGGPIGYAQLLEAVADPTHESFEELNDWLNGGRDIKFEPSHFDLELTNDLLRGTAHYLRQAPRSR